VAQHTDWLAHYNTFTMETSR